MQFQRNDKKRSAQPASEGRPAKDLQPTKSIRSGTARDSFSQTPHMRGKDDEGRLKLRHVGITPACAGKRLYYSCALATLEDHPRTCGEKLYTPCMIAPKVGSPPHMRGKVLILDDVPGVVGITPACAGKRAYNTRYVPRRQDHPRMCGEKQEHVHRAVPGRGSPPHVRGKADAGAGREILGGITPACAGKRK